MGGKGEGFIRTIVKDTWTTTRWVEMGEGGGEGWGDGEGEGRKLHLNINFKK